MYAQYIITVIILLLSSSLVNAQCSVSIRPTLQSSWASNGVNYHQYSISVSNTGSCPISTLYGLFTYSGSQITQSYNYDTTSGQISGFGDSIAAGATYSGAGFTIQGDSAPVLSSSNPKCPSCTASVQEATSAPTTAPTAQNCYNSCPTGQVCANLNATAGPQCHPTSCSALQCQSNQVCIADGGVARCETTSSGSAASASTATSAPTAAPTAQNCYNSCPTGQVCANLNATAGPQCHPISCTALQCQSNQVCIGDGGVARCETVATSSPTTAATVPPPSPSGAKASVSVSVAARQNGAGTDSNGKPTQIWDLTFEDLSQCEISTLNIHIAPPAGSSISSSWNLAAVSGSANTYSVSTYGAMTGSGSYYYGSGFVLDGSLSAPSISIVTATCA